VRVCVCVRGYGGGCVQCWHRYFADVCTLSRLSTVFYVHSSYYVGAPLPLDFGRRETCRDAQDGHIRQSDMHLTSLCNTASCQFFFRVFACFARKRWMLSLMRADISLPL
jgi:hypothetical protein